MKVLCYGDSNTYGYDPRSFFGGRYDAECRWVDLLAEKTGWNIKNEGMNGREIPFHVVSVPADTDLLIVMLGSNDLLQGNSVKTTARRMETFLQKIALDRTKILLIGPPPMKLGEWVSTSALVEASKDLNNEYKALAERVEICFANAGEWNVPLAYDGVHFTEEGHRVFAEGLYEYLCKGE